MMIKIKIYILALLALPLTLQAVTVSLHARPADILSADAEVKKKLWRLAGWLPQKSAELEAGWRILEIDNVPGLPPTVIKLFYDDALSPWPGRFSIEIRAEDDTPELLSITDAKPFGGPNIEVNGAKIKEHEKNTVVYALINNINIKLENNQTRIGEISWIKSGNGLELAKVKMFYGARLGANDLYLARFNPNEFAVHPWHESQFPPQKEEDIKFWAQRLSRAVLLINGGQYYPDRTYMGLLRSGGVDVSGKTHKDWQGFFVSGPKEEAPPGTPAAAIIDYDTHKERWHIDDYRNVMQSFMLLDRLGRIRVRDSYNLASRAAIACDSDGRIVMAMTSAAMSLYDLALVLKSPQLDLVEVVGLDGGFEAQILVRQDESIFTALGSFSISSSRSLFLPGYSASLPVVLSVEPMASSSLKPLERE